MNNNILWGKEVYPHIISVLDSMNISRDYAPYVFAMAANESGWGLNPSGKYNYFGMKATKNLKGTVRTTHEGFGSNRVKINDKFLDFESLQDGIKRGIERLNNRFGAFSVPVKLFTWNLHLNGYYTDTPAHYEDTINGIINGRSFRNVLNGLSIPERLNINQTNWNSVPRWQPPVQFKKGGNLISKFRQGGPPRRYYTTNSNILPELVITPLRSSYVVDEFGNPARTIDTLKEAQKYGGYAGVIRDAMSGRELRNNLKLQGRDVYLAQQREADQIAKDRTDGLSEGFANLMTLGAASTLKDGTQDFKNGHYLSGGFKLITPLMIPAFAKAPGMMIRGMVGGSLADNWSNYMWARTVGRGKTFAQDISDATGGRISEEEGHILNPMTWWGFKMGVDSHRWRPNGILGMNGAPGGSATVEDPIIYKTTRAGLPYVKSDLEALRSLKPTEHIYNGQVKRVYKLDGKLAMTELEYNALMDKFSPKRKLTNEEKELAKLGPAIIKRLKKKGIDFTEDAWFQGRGELGSNKPDAVTQLDLDIYHSHMPEMERLAESLQASGDLVEKSPDNWFGNIEGEMKRVDPAEYIAYRSNAFQDNGWYWDGVNYKRAMTNELFNDILKNGDIGKTTWTTDDSKQANVFVSEPPRSKLVLSIVGNIHKSLWKLRPSRFAKERRELTSGVEYSPNVSYRGTTGNYLLFGHDVPVKSVRGNNLDYSKLYKGLYKALIPTIIIGGTYIGSLDNNL